MKDLEEKAIRGGFARLCAQGVNFGIRIGSLLILARLLDPKDFGLVGTVTAFTGVLELFRDFGLSPAAVQHPTVTDEEISTLFWINILVGVLLGLVALTMAPAIATFYHEPRPVDVTVVLALGLLFNTAGVQLSVILQRQTRFVAVSVINITSLIVSSAIARGGALAGCGYRALVALAVNFPLSNTLGLWIAAAWVAGMPHWSVWVRSKLSESTEGHVNSSTSQLSNLNLSASKVALAGLSQV